MTRKLPIFYSALLLTAVNLLLRLVSTSFQVYLSGRIGAAGVGLVQLVMSVGMLAMTAGMAGIRTATMYLTAEELGHKRPHNLPWVLSGAMLYSAVCAGTVSLLLYFFAPQIAAGWLGDKNTVPALRLLAAFLPISCLTGVFTGYFTARNRIGTLAAVEVAEQLFSMGLTVSMLALWAGTDGYRASLCVVAGSGLGSCLTLLLLVIFCLFSRQKAGAQIPLRSRLLESAVPLALADDLKAGINTAENLMVPKRLSFYPGAGDPLALFGTVCGMVFPVLMFPAAILFGLAELLIPELARCAAAKSHARIRYLITRGLRIGLLYGCLCSGLLFLLSDTLGMGLYQNPNVGFFLRRFSLLVPMLYCDAITDAMTKGLGQQKACVRYNILTSSMDVVLLYILLPRSGMDGYYASFLVTHLLNFLLSIRRLAKIGNLTFSVRKILAILLAAAAALWAAGLLSSPVLRAAAYPVLLASLLTLLGIFSKEDIFWLKGLLLSRHT